MSYPHRDYPTVPAVQVEDALAGIRVVRNPQSDTLYVLKDDVTMGTVNALLRAHRTRGTWEAYQREPIKRSLGDHHRTEKAALDALLRAVRGDQGTLRL